MSAIQGLCSAVSWSAHGMLTVQVVQGACGEIAFESKLKALQ